MRTRFAGGLLMAGALAAAWAYMVSDEQRFEALARQADALLDRLGA